MTPKLSAADYRALLAAGEARLPGSRKSRRNSPEADLVKQIKDTLEPLGYQVAGIGQRIAKGSGTTVGFPDLAVRHPTWPRGVAVLLETKAGRNRLTTEQDKLHRSGWSYEIRTVAEAFDAVQEVGRCF